MRSNQLIFTFTAPYNGAGGEASGPDAGSPVPWYDVDAAHTFNRNHGLGVRAVGASAAVGGFGAVSWGEVMVGCTSSGRRDELQSFGRSTLAHV